MFKTLRIIIYFFLAIFVVFAAIVVGHSLLDGRVDMSVADEEIEKVEYSTIDVDFRHSYRKSRGVPYTAGAIIDVDNNGTEELFLGGGVLQADALLLFMEDHFVNVVEQAGMVKQGDEITLGATVIDIDNNGYDDLIISREHAIWLYSNINGSFTMEKLNIIIPEGAVPLRVSVIDINRDGHVDLFVPFVRRTTQMEWLLNNKAEKSISPRLYLNDSSNSFFDITATAGLENLEEVQQAIFTDLDNDDLEDLAVIHTSGRLSTWKNLGNLLFENKAHFHSNRKGYFMGIAAGDYDANGRKDLFITNRGWTQPRFLTNLLAKEERITSEWILMNNSGFFSFRDGAEEAGLVDHELSRGAIFSDLNNDGRKDLVVAQNHPYWPLHRFKSFRLPGRMFMQTSDATFAESGNSETVNPSFSVTPLQADFNHDGYPDIVHVNLDGPTRVFISKGGKNHFLKVKLPNNAKSLGAIVQIKTFTGKIIETVHGPKGELCGDSSHVLLIGLGQEKAVDVMVRYADGERDQTSGVLYNTTVNFD